MLNGLVIVLFALMWSMICALPAYPAPTPIQFEVDESQCYPNAGSFTYPHCYEV